MKKKILAIYPNPVKISFTSKIKIIRLKNISFMTYLEKSFTQEKSTVINLQNFLQLLLYFVHQKPRKVIIILKLSKSSSKFLHLKTLSQINENLLYLIITSVLVSSCIYKKVKMENLEPQVKC